MSTGAGGGDPYDVQIAANVASIPTTSLAILIFFSQVTILYALSWIQHHRVLRKEAHSVKEERIHAMTPTPKDVHAVLSEFSQLGVILLYVWMCENRPLYSHGDKWHDLDFFYFLSFGLICASFLTIKENKKGVSDLLNRDQTEEWKGWMQVMFLLYHYFHVGEVYNAIRVMISCYVWMTGFGNFSFFYIKQDFGFVRFYQMMWRLNFLVFFLCWTTNNLYILYYICPLHTFYFLMTFATMYVYSSINHTQYAGRIKLFIVGCLIYIIWEFGSVFNFLFILPQSPHEGYAVGRFGIQYEWHFRSGLDHYSTYFGMIFAMNFPQATLWLKQVEASDRNITVKFITGAILVALTYVYYREVYLLPKLEYNALHPYTFIIPLTAYIFLRNSTKYLRERRAVLLETIGKVTLETYLLQHHVWLTSNAKSLLVLLPNYPRTNFLLVTIIYFVLSRKLYRLTINLRARCIPDNFNGAVLSLIVFITIFSLSYLLSWILQKLMLQWVLFVALMVLFGGCAHVSLSNLIKRAPQTSADLRNYVRYGSMISSMLFILLALLMNLPVSNLDGNIIGPFRPHMDLFNLNQDRTCLSFVNEYSIRDFDFKKLESSHEFFLDVDKILHLSQAPSNLAYKAPFCKSIIYHSSHVKSLLKNKSILFVGRREASRALETLLEGFELDYMRSRGRFGEIYSIKSIRFQAVHTKKFPTDLNDYAAIVFDFISLREPPVNKNEADYYYDESGQFTTFDAIISMIRSTDKEKPIIFISPVRSKNYNPSIAKKLMSGNLPNQRIGLVDLNKLYLQANVHRSVLFQKALPQLLLHNLHILFNDVMFQDKARQLNNRSLTSSNSGGVAEDSSLGMLILFLSAVLLLTSDSYFGVAYLVKKIFAPSSGAVTWEESVRSLHQSIGIKDATSSNSSAISEEDEKEKLLI